METSDEVKVAPREYTMEEKQEITKRFFMVNALKPSGVVFFHTQFDMVTQFHVGAEGKGGCAVGDLSKAPNLEVLLSRYGLMKEEFGEDGGIEFVGQIARGELAPSLENLATVLDWVCDMNYFLMGLAVNLGLPYDTAFLAVHNANMQKVLIPGGPQFREDGKVLKPEGWVNPGRQIFEAMLQKQKEDIQNRSSGEVANDPTSTQE